MLNSVQLVGRVGGDPDVKYFDSGTVKCRLTLAVNRDRKDSPPDWFELELWGKTAEIAASYVRKGSQISILGSLKIDSWTDKNTNANRSKPVVKVDKLGLLGSKKTEPQAETNDQDYGF